MSKATQKRYVPTPGGPIIAALTTVAVSLFVGMQLRRRLGSSAQSAKAGGTAAPGAPLVPKASGSATATRVAPLAERLTKLWTEGTGENDPPSPAALEILTAQSWLEGGIGAGWKGAMIGSENLGARQCDQSEQPDGAPTKAPYYRCVGFTDSAPQSDGSQKTFAVKFRYYVDAPARDGTMRTAAEWAALDYLKSIKQFGGTPGLAALRAGDVNEYAKILYYGPGKGTAGVGELAGFLPIACACFFDDSKIARACFVVERGSMSGYYGGFGATPEIRIAGYVKGIASHLPAVAAALGHASVLARVG